MSGSPFLEKVAKGRMPSLRIPQGLENLHGSARFAHDHELKDMALLEGEGVYLGACIQKVKKLTKWYQEENVVYLRHNGPEHVLAFAPTRSGKGVGLVIPTLLSWAASAVIFDIKGENWHLTSGWRRQYAGNLCLKFDPASPEGSVRFNPLAEVRILTDYEVSDVQNLITMVVDPDGKGLNDHWAKTGHALLVGAVLHCLYVQRAAGRVATLLDVAQTLSDPSKPIEETFNEMLTYAHTSNGVHPVVAASARDMLNKAENERSGVLSTAMSFLTLYRDPIVAKNTEVSDFKIRDLMNHEKPISLYLVVSPSDKERLKPLIRLLLNQIVRTLTEKMEFKDGQAVKHYKHRLLLLIDEFPTLGKLEIIQETLAFMASYGIKAYLIIQDLSQLYAAYSKDESIISNCHIRIAYAPNKIETAKLLSEMLGTTTILRKKVNVSKGAGLFANKTYSISWEEVQRPLMTPDECSRLPGAKKDWRGNIKKAGDMLIFVAGFPPIYGKQILYFKDPTFMSRARIKPPKTSDRCQGHDDDLQKIIDDFRSADGRLSFGS
jgi:type IV secretion system protein VirD4